MLAAARKSGLFSVWVGWEGDEQYLGTFNASGKQGADRVTAVKMMQDAGIDVTLFVVLGSRQDSIDSFKKTLELSERLQVGIHPVLLTPLPGTELYDAYREYLVPGLGWESFTGVRAVFEHPSPEMTARRREEEYHRLSSELFRFERIAARIGRISSQGFPATHLYSLMMQLPMKHALSKAYEEWKAEGESDGVETVTRPEQDAVASVLKGNPSMGFRAPGAGFWAWLGCIVAITIVDILEMNYYGSTSLIDLLEVVLFLNTFMILAAFMIFNRKKWYRTIDVLIDWTGDGRARKALLLRQVLMTVIFCGGQLWGYLCAFHY
jgi:hypothetical protein